MVLLIQDYFKNHELVKIISYITIITLTPFIIGYIVKSIKKDAFNKTVFIASGVFSSVACGTQRHPLLPDFKIYPNNE